MYFAYFEVSNSPQSCALRPFFCVILCFLRFLKSTCSLFSVVYFFVCLVCFVVAKSTCSAFVLIRKVRGEFPQTVLFRVAHAFGGIFFCQSSFFHHFLSIKSPNCHPTVNFTVNGKSLIEKRLCLIFVATVKK